MFKCLCAIKRPMVTYQCHCDPTILCKMKLIASCIAFWRPVVSNEHSVLFFHLTRDHYLCNDEHLPCFWFVVNDVYHFFLNLRFFLRSAESSSDAIQIYTRSKKTTWQNGFWWGEEWFMWKWPSSHPLWMSQSHKLLLIYVGVYGKPEEANWPPRAHAEGVKWTKDFMQDCWSCRWKVSSDFVERALAYHISAIAFVTSASFSLQSHEYQWDSCLGHPHAPWLQWPLSWSPTDQRRARMLPLSLQHLERGEIGKSDIQTGVTQRDWWNFDKSVWS